MEAYGEDLAYIHDVGYGDFARRASGEILGILRSFSISKGVLADVGCGSGIWAQIAQNAGFSVFGTDISAAMIAIAQRRTPEARFEVGSFLDVRLPKCVVITAMSEVLNYLFDERNDSAALGAWFQKAYSALEPGGVLIFDLRTELGLPPEPVRRFSEGEDWAVCVEISVDAALGVLSRRIVSFRLQQGDLYRREEETHLQRVFSEPEVLRLLQGAGFRAEALASYGGMVFAKTHRAFVAQKPAAGGASF